MSPHPVQFAPRYNPLQSDPAAVNTGSNFTLEFRNGKRARDRWVVNRLITLVGRASECKIRLSADDIAAYHCGLVLTPSSLWVVDLSGRGVVVNGERMRVSPLEPGAELWIGRFLIGLDAKSVPTPVSPGRALLDPTDGGAASSPYDESDLPAEDEVPLGIAPPRDPNAGLPSSHIMADAFQVWGTGPGGGVSHPILVSGSGPPPAIYPVAPGQRPSRTQLPKTIEAVGAPPANAPDVIPSGCPVSEATTAVTVASLLRQLGELHGQMLTQFEQSLGLMVRLFACLGPEQLPAMQQELARIQELNGELGHLQAELARRAADKLLVEPQPIRVLPSPPPATLDSTALHDWVADRIGSLQKERQARWKSLVGMFSAAESR